MAFEGTVLNGVVVLDGGPRLPEGTRVRVDLEMDDDDIGPPPSEETYEDHLAFLRESIAEAKAGVGGVEARQFLKEIAIKYNLPLLPGE